MKTLALYRATVLWHISGIDVKSESEFKMLHDMKYVIHQVCRRETGTHRGSWSSLLLVKHFVLCFSLISTHILCILTFNSELKQLWWLPWNFRLTYMWCNLQLLVTQTVERKNHKAQAIREEKGETESFLYISWLLVILQSFDVFGDRIPLYRNHYITKIFSLLSELRQQRSLTKITEV